MNIKTWQERTAACEAPRHHDFYTCMMQAEIDELRAALKERDAEIQRQYACIASHARITQAAEGKVEAQRKVLEQVLNTLIDVTASINMKRFWRDKDGKRFDEITDTAITAIQEQLK